MVNIEPLPHRGGSGNHRRARATRHARARDGRVTGGPGPLFSRPRGLDRGVALLCGAWGRRGRATMRPPRLALRCGRRHPIGRMRSRRPQIRVRSLSSGTRSVREVARLSDSTTGTQDGNSLPFPPTPSASVAGRTMQESVYQPRVTPRRLPDDAPNILIVMIDDGGPGQPSTFGGEINTPTMDRIVGEGSRITGFTPRRCARPLEPHC